MLDGTDFAEAFSESMIKSALSAGLMMGVVGAAGTIGVAVPTVVVFGVSLITSKVVNYLFDKDIFAINW